MMKITIDCRMIHASGIGVYLKGCLPYFIETQNHFLLIGERRRLAEFSGKANVSVLHCDTKPFSITETFFPPARLVKAVNGTDLFYSPYFNLPARINIPVYTTIHDIIFADMPELCSPAGLAARTWFYRRAVRLSKKLFTVSLFSKGRIEYHLGTAKPVIVTHSAVQEQYLRQAGPHPSCTDQTEKTILFVGNIKKHKGLCCLLEAFFQARKSGLDYRLIIAGEKNNFRTSDGGMLEKLIDESGERQNVLFTGFVPADELQNLVKRAALLVQPSLYEGFGLPPLEALLSGTPALVSDIAVFRELYSSYPVTYFRAGDSADLKEKLVGLLSGGIPPRVDLPESLRLKYTFEKTAKTILEEWQCAP
ncbi:MAG: glycosyltransferase family 4 protein [Spirochaetaceae bacterium]|jgi:glycosyltransferase involved in cell wall biosynthesis|nr:glycosyltransferase family 4 protein [Spirochaetaceae bacterium]